MHYTSGSGAVALFGIGALLPGDGLLQAVARLLLDAAGLLFGLYLLAAVALSLTGARMRRLDRIAGPAAAGEPQ